MTHMSWAENYYLTVFSWKSSRTKTFIIVDLINTFPTIFTWIDFAFVYINFTMITAKSSGTFAFETTKCILNTIVHCFKIQNRMRKLRKIIKITKKTRKLNQKWCWISRFDTIQLVHHQEFEPLIMWFRRKVQIRIKNSHRKNTSKKSRFFVKFHFSAKIPWGVKCRLRTKHWPPFWQGEKALSGSHSFMSK